MTKTRGDQNYSMRLFQLLRTLIASGLLLFSLPVLVQAASVSHPSNPAIGESERGPGQVTGGTVVASDFEPYPLLKNRHLQTIWPRLFHWEGSQDFIQQKVWLPDGDFIDLDWFPGSERSKRIAVLVHGLGGSSGSHYIKRVGRYLVENGFKTVVFNLRGATEPNLTSRSYHSGETSDLYFILNLINEQYPSSEIYAAGFSLGGNMLLKWLGENPDQEIVDRAVAVSPPFDLFQAIDQLNQGSSSIYQYAIMRGLREYLKSKEELLVDEINLQAAYEADSISEYDNAVTAPLYGFDNASDYYAKSSCGPFLEFITTPTLIIHSRDDPFGKPQMIPPKSDLGPGVILEVSNRGGHVGFVAQGNGATPQYWLPGRIFRYFSS